MHGPCCLDSGQQTEVRRRDSPTSGCSPDAVYLRDAGRTDVARGDVTFHYGISSLGCGNIEIIVNGLIPEAETVNPFFRKRREMQQTYLERARQLYADMPVQTMELLDSEIKGVAMFRKCAPMLFQGGTKND